MSQKITIYLDQQFKKIAHSELKNLTPGQLKGLGVFETLLCRKGKIFFLEEHYRRFVYGCDRYILPAPPSLKTIKGILKELMKINALKEGRVRLLSWRKASDTHFAVMLVERHPFSKDVYQRGFTACIFPQRFDRSPELTRIKTLDYHLFLKSYEYALKQGHQEALFVNSSGEIVEGSRSNVFVIKTGKIFTPHVACGCLSGVTRQAVLKAAKTCGIKVGSGRLQLEDLRQSEEAFLTNSLIGIIPLTAVQGRPIGSGRPGPLTQRLSKSYEKLSQKKGAFLL